MTSSKIKEHAKCNKCGNVWKPLGVKINESCPLCGHNVDIRDRSEWVKKYLLLHPERKEKMKLWRKEHGVEYSKRQSALARRRVLVLISKDPNLHCVRCGCDDIRLLEINHKNGCGTEEYTRCGTKFYYDIIRLRRKTDDLEILCRVCNAWHYLELKTKSKLPYTIKWGK